MKVHRLAWSGCGALARGLWTLAVWLAWLALALLLALQAYVALTKELDVPGFVLRGIEQRLAASGVHARFGRTIFDPTGVVLFEDVAVTLPGFDDQVVTARSITVILDPWALAAGRIEPAELRVTGGVLRVPAMISPSGRPDEIVSDLDACLHPRGPELGIEWLNFRLGEVGVSVRGAVHVRPPRGGTPPLPVADFLARDYAGLSRRLDGVVEALAVLDHPSVSVELVPSQADGAMAEITMMAQGLRLPGESGIRTGPVIATARLPVAESADAAMPGTLELRAGEMDFPHGIVARRVSADLRVTLPPGRLRLDAGVIQGLDLAAADVSGLGFTLEGPLVSLTPGPLPRVTASVRAAVLGSPFAAGCDIDSKAGSGSVSFDGGLPAGLLDPVGALLHRDLHRYVAIGAPVRLQGGARFAPGWKFRDAAGLVELRRTTVWHVPLDEARARVSFDGRTLQSPEAYLRMGDSYARGTFWQDMPSRDYRMVLDGALRPPAIGPWFPPQSWWHEFFRNFEFPSGPPAAKADVHGSWANSRKARVFVAVDSAGPVVRGVPFDRLRTRLYIRPGLDDGIFFLGTSGSRTAGGTFARSFDPGSGLNRRVDFDVSSTFDLPSAGKIMGPKEQALLEPFGFDLPPVVHVKGRIDGPADGRPSRETLHIEAKSDGPFRFHDFPFSRVSFISDVLDDDIRVAPVEAGFAGGAVAGGGRLRGRGADQRVSFDGSVKGASLGQAIATVEAFVARRAHRPPPVITKFLKEKSSVKLDVAASGEGRADDFLSYHGAGKASISGAELGELRMLGLFTELLPFMSLRFTAARSDFTIDGSRLVFSDVDVTGANSAIKAHGTYGLAKHQLDFNAKLFPFGKSRTLPQELIGGVLMPLSEVLEVRLTGDVENPSWVFENGPTNFIRNLAGAGEPKGAPPGPPAAPKTK